MTVTETYRYTGPVDPVDNSITCNETPNDPNNCNNFVGAMIARQMVAANSAPASTGRRWTSRSRPGPSASTDGGTVSSSATLEREPR